MRASRAVVLVVIVLIISALCSTASAKEIIVGNNSGADFISIQEAVNSSSSGGVILVSPGFYNESVDINVDSLSILSKSENPEDTTVRALKLGENNHCKRI